MPPPPAERRAKLLTEEEKHELVNAIASATARLTADAVLQTLTSAAQEAERKDNEDLGRTVKSWWDRIGKWGRRLLSGAGLLGSVVVAHAHGAGTLTFGHMLESIGEFFAGKG
jgi:hypothetical protein